MRGIGRAVLLAAVLLIFVVQVSPTHASGYQTITLEGKSITTAASGINTVYRPEAAAPGDLAVATVTGVYTTSQPQTPTGWTLLDQDKQSVGSGRYDWTVTLYRVLGDSEPVTYAFNSGGFDTDVSLFVYHGVDVANPIAGHALFTQLGGGSPLTAPTVTADQDSEKVVHTYRWICTTGTYTLSSPQTDRGSLFVGADNGQDIASDETVSAGSVSGRTVSDSGCTPGGPEAATSIALRPAATAPQPSAGAGLPAPTFVSASSNKTTTGYNQLGIAAPAGVQSGDMLLAELHVEFSGGSITPPAGWTQIDQVGYGSNPDYAPYNGIGYRDEVGVFYKIAGANEPGSYVFTGVETGNAITWTGQIVDYRGVDTANPIAGHSLQPTDDPAETSSPTAYGLQTTSQNVRLVSLWAYWTDATANVPSGETQRSLIDNTVDQEQLTIADEVFAPGGWTDSRSASTSGCCAYQSFAALVALRPGNNLVAPLGQTEGYAFANNPSASIQDPVNTATGAFWTQEMDMQMPGIGVDFKVERSYNSLDATVGDFGAGWAWSYGSHLSVAQNGDVTVFAPDGQQVVFTLQGDGSYAAAGATSTLALANGAYTLTDQGAQTYKYDTSGHLLRLADRNGNAISFGYNGNGVLQTIADTAGRQITVSHDPASGFISEIALPDGRHVDYGYTNGLLTTVTDLRGKAWHYAYDANGRLASIQDPLSHYETRNTYDATSGRITQQLDAFGNPTTFSWDSSTQTATTTDPNNKVWTDVYNGNKLVARIDPLGNKTTYSYDANFNRTSVTSPRGNVAGCNCAAQYTTTMSYDDRGNMLARTAPAPLSYQETWTYNADNDVLTYRDGRQHETDFQYDANGNLSQKTSPGNLVTLYGRDPNGTGLLVSMTTPRSKTWHYGYDSAGNKISETDPLGDEKTYGYDSTGRLTSITDARGNVAGCNCAATYTTQLSYDNADHVLTKTDPLGHQTIYTYDDNANKQTVENAKQETTSYGYNAANELTSISYPDTSSVSYSYDARGNKTSETDQLGHETTFSYDDANRLIGKVSPLGNVQGGNPADYTTSYGYDPDGNLTSVTDPLGNKTTYSYDALNRKTSLTTPRGNVAGCGCASQYTTNYAYDANGNLTSVTDPLGNQTQYSYDAADRQTSITDGRNKTTSYGYDGDGNQTSITDQDGNKTTFSYDDADRFVSKVDPRGNVVGCNCAAQYTTSYAYDPANDLIRVTDPNNHVTQFGYDAAGRKTSVTDPKLHETDYGYDQLDRLTSVTAPASGTTQYSYDNVGNLTSRIDAKNHETDFSYDLAHRLTSVTKPSGEWTYSYDANDELTSKVDANGNATPGIPSDGTTTYSYYHDGTLASTNYSDSTPTVTYQYDPDGNVTQMTDGQTNAAVYTWNADERLTSSTRGSSAFGYQYDAAGNVSQRTYPDGTVVNYGYDNEERPSTVAVGANTTSYGYDPAGELTSEALPSGNGYATTMQYNPAGQLTEVKNAKGATVLSQYDVSYDANGNPLQLTAQNSGSSWVENYTYDDANRLTGVCYNAACASATDYQKWTYDNVGNRLTEADPNSTSTAYNYNSADEVTSAVTTSPATSNPYPSHVTADGAQPYWRFAETSGSSFASAVGSYTGTWSGSPSLNQPGALSSDSNGSVKLNGSSQYGNVPNATGLSKSNNFTLEVWFKRAGGTGTLQALAGKPLTTTTKSENYALWLTTGNKVEFQVGNGTNKSQVLDSSGTITDTTNWHHVVATFASGVMKLYLDNGSPTTVTAAFTAAGTNTSTFDIGRAGAANYFNGSLDEMALYGSVLTATQIADHYTTATTTPPPVQTTKNYGFDADGQQTSAGNDNFAFNVAGELSSMTVGGTTTSFGYDGTGNRLSTTSSGSMTNFLWDTNSSLPQLAEETNGSGSVLRTYVNGIGPVSVTTPAGSFYYSQDANGSVADLTSSTGTTEWAYQYTGFGGSRAISKVDPNAPANPIQYDSQYADGNGLYYLHAREFDSNTGRFLSTDPLTQALPDSYVSAYAYAGDQPTLYDDPSGQCKQSFGLFSVGSGQSCTDAALDKAKSIGSDAAQVGRNFGNYAIGVGEGAYNTARATADFIVNYPTYFNQIRNGVAQGGWGYLAQIVIQPFAQCVGVFQTGDFRAAGRGCFKAAFTADAAAGAARAAASGLARLGPNAAAILRDQTGSFNFAGEDAYDVAAAGGKHAGFLKNYEGRSPQEIDRGIRSIEREIAEHEAAIRDPRTKIPNWDELDPRQQVALVTKKWPSDIARQQEQLAILRRLRSGG